MFQIAYLLGYKKNEVRQKLRNCVLAQTTLRITPYTYTYGYTYLYTHIYTLLLRRRSIWLPIIAHVAHPRLLNYSTLTFRALTRNHNCVSTNLRSRVCASFSDVLTRADAMKANACLSALPTEREFESCWSKNTRSTPWSVCHNGSNEAHAHCDFDKSLTPLHSLLFFSPLLSSLLCSSLLFSSLFFRTVLVCACGLACSCVCGLQRVRVLRQL